MFEKRKFQPFLLVAGALSLVSYPELAMSQVASWQHTIQVGDEFRQQGRYREAEQSYREALREAEALGTKDARLASTLDGLGSACVDVGKLGEAEPLYRQSLAMSESLLGPEHPSVARVLNNFGHLCFLQARFSEAESLYRRALVIREKTLGADHPELADTLSDLGVLYSQKGHTKKPVPSCAEPWQLTKKLLDRTM